MRDLGSIGDGCVFGRGGGGGRKGVMCTDAGCVVMAAEDAVMSYTEEIGS